MTIPDAVPAPSNERSSNSSLRQSEVDLSQVDLQRIKDLLAGRNPARRKVTIKSLVESQLVEIRAALSRGLSLADVAEALQEGGVPISESTLRKYLYLMESGPRRNRPSPQTTKNAGSPSPDLATRASVETPVASASPPRRSLSRNRQLQSQVAKEGSSK